MGMHMSNLKMNITLKNFNSYIYFIKLTFKLNLLNQKNYENSFNTTETGILFFLLIKREY